MSVVFLNFFFGQYTLDECGDGALSAASSLALAINICYVLGATGIFLYYFIAEMKAEKAKKYEREAQEVETMKMATEHMADSAVKQQKKVQENRKDTLR